MRRDDYTEDEIKANFQEALDTLYVEDSDLIDRDVNERSITHRLAIHLERAFHDWEFHVDCEYNRNGNNPKYIILSQEDRRILNEDISCTDTEAKTAYPDIIIHRRRNNDQNLLIIEAKKGSEGMDDQWNQNEFLDRRKLEAFTSDRQDYCYRWGVFIRFQPDRAVVKWFRYGSEEEGA